MDTLRSHLEHIVLHIGMHTSHNNCPECRADNSRSFATGRQFNHTSVPADAMSKYLAWIRPRLEAIRTKTQGGDTVEAIWWQRDFMRALHNRINSHIPNQNGRKHAPEYAKYHLATYGNDYRYLHSL